MLALAFVFSELDWQTLLRVRSSLQSRQRNRKLAITRSTDSDCGGCTEPLDNPKITLSISLGMLSGLLKTSVPELAWRQALRAWHTPHHHSRRD
jgi:hypothetical protein